MRRARVTVVSADGPVWSAVPVGYLRGLCATDLIEDIGRGPFTLIAPTREAWLKLPLPLDHLLFDPNLVEARFDVFEYLVIRGIHFAQRERRSIETLQGGDIELGENRVVGRYGGANVVRSFIADALLVHVVDGLVFPTLSTLPSPPRLPVPYGLLRPVNES